MTVQGIGLYGHICGSPVIRDDERAGAAVTGNYIVVILGVKAPQLIKRYTHFLIDLLEVQVAVHLKGVCLRRHTRLV